MQLTMKKMSTAMLTLAFVLSGVFGAFGAKAEAAARPILGVPKDVTSTSVVLPVKSQTFKNKMVIVKVRIENEDTDKQETRSFRVKLDKKGRANITVDKLASGTEFKFKVKLRKVTLDRFTDFSVARSVNTLQ